MLRYSVVSRCKRLLSLCNRKTSAGKLWTSFPDERAGPLSNPNPGRSSEIASFFANRATLNRLAILLLLLSLCIFPAAYCLPFLQDEHPNANIAKFDAVLTSGAPTIATQHAGETHAYAIDAISGEYIRILVTPQESPIVVNLLTPSGQQLIEIQTPYGVDDFAPVLLLAVEGGRYTLTVRASDREHTTSTYQVVIDERRRANAEDSMRVKAQALFVQAEKERRENNEKLSRAAVADYTSVLSMFKVLEDRRGEAMTLNNIGSVYRDLGESRETVEYCASALSIWVELHDSLGEADTRSNLADGYAAIGEVDKALDQYSQALSLCRRIGKRQGEAIILNNLGILFYHSGDYAKALSYFDQALPVVDSLRDRRTKAYLLNNIGWLHSRLGENRKALEYMNQAWPEMVAMNDRRGQSDVSNNIALIYSHLGEYDKAINSFLGQALPLKRSVGDRIGEGTVLCNIGWLYTALGDHGKGLEYANECLAVRRASQDKRGEASALNDIAKLKHRLGNDESALQQLTTALPLAKAAKDRRMEGTVLNSFGRIYLDGGATNKALEYFEQALSIRRSVKDRSEEGTTLNDIGQVYALLHDSQASLGYLNQALAIRQSTGDKKEESVTLYWIARVERDLAQWSEALRHIQSAYELSRSLRANVASSELRTSYSATTHDQKELYIDVLMNMHQHLQHDSSDSLAFEVAEGSRARSLVELLSSARADVTQGVDIQLLRHKRELEELIDSKTERQLSVAYGDNGRGKSINSEREIEKLLDEYQQVQERIRAISPQYADLMQPQPLTTGEIQRSVIDKDAELIEYAVGEDASYAWVVTPTEIVDFKLPGRLQLEELVRRARTELAARPESANIATAEQTTAELRQRDDKSLARISSALLGPMASFLNARRLLIVPDGALDYVPFAALSEPGTTVPLIVNHEVVTLPSASVLATIRREFAHRPLPQKVVAVLADPVFDSNDPRLKSKTRIRQTSIDENLERAVGDVNHIGESRLPRLPFTRQEAEAIMSTVNSGDKLKAVDFDASLKTIQAGTLREYRIIHLATHGLINSVHPELSGLVLSLFDSQGNSQNGFLKLQNVYNLNLPSELVVLSACETALGSEIKEEGIVGLTRGFMYAGAKRVMASLWQVDDFATAELMRRFYRGMLVDHMPPAAALRSAQIAIWKNRRWSSPYYWAGFVLEGEYE